MTQARTRRPWTASVRRRCSIPSGCALSVFSPRRCARVFVARVSLPCIVPAALAAMPRCLLLVHCARTNLCRLVEVASISFVLSAWRVAAQTRRGHCAAESGRRIPAAGKLSCSAERSDAFSAPSLWWLWIACFVSPLLCACLLRVHAVCPPSECHLVQLFLAPLRYLIRVCYSCCAAVPGLGRVFALRRRRCDLPLSRSSSRPLHFASPVFAWTLLQLLLPPVHRDLAAAVCS